MEDFTDAYKERKHDALALLDLQNNHSIAAFHLGGIAIECRLKALIVLYHKIMEWDNTSRRYKDSMYNQIIENPSHGLLTALRRMPDLYQRAKRDRDFLNHIQKIIYSLDATTIDYIKLRYIPQTSQFSDNWLQSFNYVCGWLDKNQRSII